MATLGVAVVPESDYPSLFLVCNVQTTLGSILGHRCPVACLSASGCSLSNVSMSCLFPMRGFGIATYSNAGLQWLGIAAALRFVATRWLANWLCDSRQRSCRARGIRGTSSIGAGLSNDCPSLCRRLRGLRDIRYVYMTERPLRSVFAAASVKLFKLHLATE